MDLFVFMIIGLAISIICVIMYFVADTTNNRLIEEGEKLTENFDNGVNVSSIAEESVGGVVNSYEYLKWITGLLLIAFALSIVISSFMVRTEPVFFVAYLLIYIVAIIVSVPISNTYETIYENPSISASFEGFYAQTWIFLNLPIWIITIGGIAGLFMVVNLVRASREYG